MNTVLVYWERELSPWRQDPLCSIELLKKSLEDPSSLRWIVGLDRTFLRLQYWIVHISSLIPIPGGGMCVKCLTFLERELERAKKQLWASLPEIFIMPQ